MASTCKLFGAGVFLVYNRCMPDTHSIYSLYVCIGVSGFPTPSKKGYECHSYGRTDSGRFWGLFIIAEELGLTISETISTGFNRGQDEETIGNLAGRLSIWTSCLDLAFESPVRITFGYGYGATRFHLNWKEKSPDLLPPTATTHS